ncbi:tetratricopeptide repeat protein [Virgibacillus halophilus]|uniref:Tetratricopeptide repeat protein n=1 Tax=Tigheibacillus halophilus TaxID=361280 RepID=A0ABU5CA87_9BACI|nr:tetratricopeptide repeat protein [Virgibacillus halophilus]
MQQSQSKTNPTKNQKIIPFVPEGDFYFVRGVKAFQRRKFDAATKWLKIAIGKNPKDPVFKCQLSVVYTEIGAYHEANQLLTDVLMNAKDVYVDCYYLLANNYAHLGLMDDARKYANQYLKEDPEGDFVEEAKDLLELISFEESEEEENAEWDLEDEDELLIYQETAFYYVESRQWHKALPILEQLLESFPQHQQAKHEYAQALFFSGSKQQAMDIEEENLALNDHSLYSHANLALFYFLDDQEEAYEKHIRALLNVYPMHEQQKLMVACTLARTGHLDEAFRRFRSLKKGDMDSQLSYFRWYSYTLHITGNHEKAVALWGKGQAKHPILNMENAPWE